jgi:protein-S-isoprenylcysteine O-methyltransferase Ste14
MRTQLAILLAVTAAFTLYTLAVVVDQGYTGFLTLAWREPWGGQMFVDLVIALTLFMVWMLRDARQEGIPSWPYVVLVLTTGSIGALGYLVHRSARRLGEPAASEA